MPQLILIVLSTLLIGWNFALSWDPIPGEGWQYTKIIILVIIINILLALSGFYLPIITWIEGCPTCP